MNKIPNYRVWHKIEKRFVDLRSIDFEKENIGYDAYREGNYYDIASFKDIVFQQFTGLKDSERNDIYEGDYVEYYKDEKNYLGTVSFFEGTFAVIGEHYHKNNELTVFKYRLYNLYTHIYDYKVKVVGNIFELPCKPDHNGECLVCDESLNGCPYYKNEKE